MINLKELAENKIFVGDKQVNKIYLNNNVVYPIHDFINHQKFHNLVPKTATEIKFLYASDNPDLTDYQRIGYCDDNNYIEVWNNNTKYIIINPRMNYIYAPVSCYNFLLNYTALTVCIFANFNTEKVTNMNSMFGGCSNLTTLDLSNFDTQNVTNMNSIFYKCYSIRSLDLSSFNTQNVTNMAYMFNYCNSMQNLDLNSFNTQNVTHMHNMFASCSSLFTLNISNFKTDNVQHMDAMFYGCNRLTSIISNTFDTTSLTTSLDMFAFCTSLVGGNGTTYSSSHITAEYARVDGENGLPGYFTAPAAA